MTWLAKFANLVRWLCKAFCWVITSHFAIVLWWLSGLAITITNHLAACCLSEMASCFTSQMASSPTSCFTSQMAITNHLATVFWLLSGMASRFTSSYTSSFISYTHLRAHETRHDLVCRLLLE